jgi:molybdate transport system substrate-binding protein
VSRHTPRLRGLGSALVVLAVLPGLTVAQSASPVVPALPTCAAIAEVPALAIASPAMAVSAGASGAAPRGELTVFGAASLRSAFEAFAPTYRAASGLGLVFSFDASSALRTQIEQGAPADVFASADTTNVVSLLEQGLATDPVVFACNQLAIIVPAGNPAGITSAADLGRAGVKVVAAGDEVPITSYATQLVANLGIADAYTANIVSREDNVAAVRSRIELGEGDAAVVYLTDALMSGEAVDQVPVPAGANVSATYAAAVAGSTDQPEDSRAFLAWLTSAAGQAALAASGFLPGP